MDKLQKIAQSWTSVHNKFDTERDRLNKRIQLRQAQIERLKKRKDNLDWPSWTNSLLRPLLDELKVYFPAYYWDDEQLTPIGLGAKVSVFIYSDLNYPNLDRKERFACKCVAYLVVEPADLKEGILHFETGEKINRYLPNTIGEVNGFNRLTKRVDSIEELVKFVQYQIDHPEKEPADD